MPHTILIVDDSPTSVPELKAILESEGNNVLTAYRGEEALDTLRTSKIDLIVTEALLPGMDGFELVRQIRRHEEWSSIPIVMLTVRSAPEDYAASFEAGADEYFLKPVEPPKIIAATRGLITKYESARTSGHAPLARGAHPPIPAGPVRQQRGRIITVFSLKGGVGTSTIAVNVAVAIKQLAPSTRVGLIDFGLEEGADALLLDIVPTSTMYDWAREDLSEATPYLLNQYFVQHRTGISLMAAPPLPEQAETVRPDVVRLTCQLAPEAFDYIVLDTSSTFSESSLIALESASDIILPITADMASLKTAVNTVRILKAVNINESKFHVVMNEIVPRAGLSKQQVQESLSKDPLIIPHAGPYLIDSMNHGVPLVAFEGNNPVKAALLELARSVCEPEVVESDGAKSRFGLLNRLEGGLERLRPRT